MAFLYGHKRRREAIIAILIVLCLALIMAGYAQNQRVMALSIQVNAAYHKALYETTELMGGVQLNLEKLMVSGSPARRQALLSDIARQAEGAQDNLAVLPSGIPASPGNAPGQGTATGLTALEGALKFSNQVADYARVLAEQIGAGGQMTQQDARQITALHESSIQLNRQLAEMVSAYERGEIDFAVDPSTVKTLSQKGESKDEPLVSYPVLLYDGPFSDARDTGAIKVAGEPVTAERAGALLTEYVGAERVTALRPLGESAILAECYEFEVDTQEGTLSAGVTKAGGHVLYILPNAAPDQAVLSAQECIARGGRFLSERGYGDMQVSYWRRQGGILTVNYASVQDGVTLYPDLVKLQVSMQSGNVLGVEAANYLRNHERRMLSAPIVSEEEAMAGLNAALTVEQIRLCVIPLDAGEAQCWEVTARFEGGNLYLVYLDTATGQERAILQVVQDEEGIVTQ